MNYEKYAGINLIEELKINELPKETQEKILIQMTETIQQRVVVRLFEEMSEEKQEEFEKFSQENEKEPKKIVKFLEENVENSQEIIKEEIGMVKKEMLDALGKLNK